MDCGVSLILLLSNIFFDRPFIYITPICPLLNEYFSTPLVFFKFIMVLSHHCKICKSVIQSLLVLNRMTSVLFPINHNRMWMKNVQWIVPLVLLIPLSVDWNLVISRAYMMPTYGGFWVNYIKKVSWILFNFFSFNTMVTSVFALTLFAYDFLNVGSPIVMLCISRTVRDNVFSWINPIKISDSQNFPVSITT
ncbi:hypothetical protein GCK72_002739 [Caenorhabditis remanei]|uniref:Serpentine receptor class gamma n=1 Tax=Caenorhabditis remanei TaxID=31234 RepID=A0A6A5HTM1_CAERE|nr:hypothetical protein GCK72_002739 [Caenorhabditis remanei]KAF1770915.1 hypothetical protein GCK72_002739 [Caenorhabditis remanei]